MAKDKVQEEGSPDMWDKNYQAKRVRSSKKSTLKLSWCGLVILKIFKNLIYVFVAVILGSFGGMLYLINLNNDDQMGFTGKYGLHSTAGSGMDWSNFLAAMTGDNVTIDSSVQLGLKKYVKGQLKKHGDWSIHPIFEELQRQSPLKRNPDFKMAEYDMSQNNSLNKGKFYNDHVSQSIPVVLRNDCMNWDLKQDLDAVNTNSTQNEYLAKRFAQSGSLKENAKIWATEMKRSSDKVSWQQGVGQGKIINTSYNNYTKLREGSRSNSMYYIQDLLLSPYNKMQSVFNSQIPISNISLLAAKTLNGTNVGQQIASMQGYKTPSLLNTILRQRNKLFTQWNDFQRKPIKTVYEQQICVLKGQEEFALVSPIFRQNIYVGALEELDPSETPIDFFSPDFKIYPFAKEVKFLYVKLKAGDCVYVPAYYYIQSRTLGDMEEVTGGYVPYNQQSRSQRMRQATPSQESIIFTHQYAAHSQLVDMVFSALEDQIITDDKAHQWDSKLVNYFKNLY